MVISFGYARISTKSQNIDRQINEIKKYRPDILDRNIFKDVKSGREESRDGYNALKKAVEEAELALKHLGDGWFIEIIVSEIDRLGRKSKSLVKDLEKWYEKGIIVRVLNIKSSLVDVSENNIKELLLVNKVIFEYYAAMAEEEYKLNHKRQMDGIQNMRENGDWERYGRPRCISKEEFEKLYPKVLKGELRPCDFARKYNMSIATFYRYKDEYLQNHNIS